jgi:hypothetical protein
MEPRKKRPRIQKSAVVNLKELNTLAKKAKSRETELSKPKLKAKKLKSIRAFFGKLNLSDAEYQRLGQAAMVLMKYYNYEIVKKIENINNQPIEVVVYPKRVLALIYRLHGYLTMDLIERN